MKRIVPILGVVLAAVAADTDAQCKGCGGGRSQAAISRLDPAFEKPKFPSTGESVAHADPFQSIEQIREAAKKGHASLLYVYDSRNRTDLAKFENALFKKDEKLAIAMKPFRRLKLDLAKDPVAEARYAKKAPVFIAYGAKGEIVREVAFPRYRTKSTALFRALAHASKAKGVMPLSRFVKEYRDFLNDLDGIEQQKVVLVGQRARLGENPRASKERKIQREEAELKKAESALIARERKLLEAVHTAPATARGCTASSCGS